MEGTTVSRSDSHAVVLQTGSNPLGYTITSWSFKLANVWWLHECEIGVALVDADPTTLVPSSDWITAEQTFVVQKTRLASTPGWYTINVSWFAPPNATVALLLSVSPLLVAEGAWSFATKPDAAGATGAPGWSVLGCASSGGCGGPEHCYSTAYVTLCYKAFGQEPDAGCCPWMLDAGCCSTSLCCSCMLALVPPSGLSSR